MAKERFGDSFIDLRTFFTPNSIIFFTLFKSDATFSEIIKITKLPKRTVAKYLAEFQENNMILGKRDPTHKQKIVYGLTPVCRNWSQTYFTKNVIDFFDTLQTKNIKDKTTEFKFNSDMKMNEKYMIVVFDMDGVLFRKPWENPNDAKVAVSSWDSLFKELNIYDEHEKLKSIFTAKEPVDYKAWSEAACNVLKARGLTKKFFDKFTTSHKFINGGRETIKILQENNIRTAIISGSFEALAEHAKKELGINDIAASCKLKFNEKGLLNDWIISRTDYEDKIKHFNYILKNNGIAPHNAVYVGDDVNDIPVFNEAGLSIAFNASKDNVKKASDYVVNSANLLDILPLINKGMTKIKNR